LIPHTDPSDIYFSQDNGLAETRHVFLDGNNLPQAWAGRREFTVSELGFGTGLNLLTLSLLTPPGLIYQSVEWDPVSRETILELSLRWPELTAPAQALAEVYQPQPGWNRWSWPWGQIVLFVGDARELPLQLEGFLPADAWFLDGFAPDRNPEIWDSHLFQWIGEMTKPGGTAATYSAAGVVKRALREAGFLVSRRPGWGRKRHMVQAVR
jgi:tRNA U34 5-methylaminomethyl-2-thiouridine-forming methyltransferase MnmC